MGRSGVLYRVVGCVYGRLLNVWNTERERDDAEMQQM